MVPTRWIYSILHESTMNRLKLSRKFPYCIYCKSKGKGRLHIWSACWGVLAREEICPGPLALWGRVASFFPHYLYLPSVSTRSPFPTRWTMSKNLALSSKWISNCGSLAQWASALTAMCLAHIVLYLIIILSILQVSKGLFNKFGEKRIIDTPISEVCKKAL